MKSGFCRTKAKLVDGVDSLLVEPSVIDKQAFGVVDILSGHQHGSDDGNPSVQSRTHHKALVVGLEGRVGNSGKVGDLFLSAA